MPKNPPKEKMVLKRGAWSLEEDQKLISYISRFGIWNWSEIPNHAGLSRTSKSCRLRWVNYLRPGIKRGNISKEEEETIVKLHSVLGNRSQAVPVEDLLNIEDYIGPSETSNEAQTAPPDELGSEIEAYSLLDSYDSYHDPSYDF
ncbi:hypothetical protein PTKIN_Ptkin16aG0057000 [Pterospermum kingtungense]